jgi:hypothetical protein
MKPSAKRIISILFSIFILIASLIVFSYLVKPAYNDMKDERAEIAARLKLIEEYESSLARVQKLLSEYQNAVKFQEMIGLMLPAKQNLPQAVNQVIGLANVNKLAVDILSVQRLAIRPSPRPELAKGVGTLRINARLVGDYENFRGFIENLETNVNLMDLASLKMEPWTRLKTGEVKFGYTMNIDTYYQTD